MKIKIKQIQDNSIDTNTGKPVEIEVEVEYDDNTKCFYDGVTKVIC